MTTLAGTAAAQFYNPQGLAVGVGGNVYVADTDNNQIRKITPAGVVTILAGSTRGYRDGAGTAAQFFRPGSVAIDASGNLYVADEGNNRIRKITTAGVVTTLAGSTQGYKDGTGTVAQFYFPTSVAVGADSNIYVADEGNNRLRKITAAGVVTTLAGSTQGYKDGTGTAAQFFGPNGVAADANGNIYVADYFNNRIRKITLAGVVTTLAGSGTPGYKDGTGTAAQFYGPSDVAVDAGGNVYVADDPNQRVRKIASAGVVTTLAGNGTPGYQDGTGTSAEFNSPYGVAVDTGGNVYVADCGNSRIRKISNASPTPEPTPIPVPTVKPTPTPIPTMKPTPIPVPTVKPTSTPASLQGIVSTFAGTGAQTVFWVPLGVAVDGAGNVYVADSENSRIRKISSAGVVTTLAGGGTTPTVTGGTTTSGYRDGAGTAAQFNYPSGAVVDVSGNVYVADSNNQRVRKITPSGVVSTLAGSTRGYQDGAGTVAQFDYPLSVAVDVSGNVYVADSGNNRIRKITPSGVVTTLAGSSQSYQGGYKDGAATVAQFNYPASVAVDVSGNVYVADGGNNCIRKITSSGIVTTIAGSTAQGYQDGTGSAAQFYNPTGVAVDASGNVYVGDNRNNRIRKITPSGVVSTLAGSSTQGYKDGTGTGAQFYFPWGVAVDAGGNVYVADSWNGRIRKIR